MREEEGRTKQRCLDGKRDDSFEKMPGKIVEQNMKRRHEGAIC
jgi:hypothetical protein